MLFFCCAERDGRDASCKDTRADVANGYVCVAPQVETVF